MAERRKELEEKEKDALFLVKKDLSNWLSNVLKHTIQPHTFISDLDTGVLLCQLVSNIQEAARHRENIPPPVATRLQVPLKEIHYNKSARKESFQARDNAANFIAWCRELGIEDAVMFESEGLVLHKDERSVILCLLAVARVAADVGMTTSKLIELEREIDRLEENDKDIIARDKDITKEREGLPPKNKRQRRDSLDEKVLAIFNQCTCKRKLQVVNNGCGKFHITTPSGRRMTIHVRILSDRAMVRVGGGWDSIEHFILKYDPCRQGVITSQVLVSSLKKETEFITPNVKITVESTPKHRPRLQRKAKQMSPYATPVSSTKRQISTPMSGIKKSISTPSLSSRKRRADQ